MVGLGPNREESVGSQRQDHFFNLEQRGDREVSVHTTHTNMSYSRNMQLEIDHLRRNLRCKQRKGTPSSSESQSDDDDSYRPRSRTPPSESFSYVEDCHHKRRSKSPGHRGLGNDVMSRALRQISKSPFTRRIEGGKLPRRFTQPTFTKYNGRMDQVEHVSHFNQRMVVHSKNEALMCKVFPSSLGPVAMRWFDGLEDRSISSFQELTKVCGARFVTYSRVPHPLDSILSWLCERGETLKTYSDRYWEMFNEIDGNFDVVAIRTFKVGLATEHDLRKSLTRKPARNMRQLMDQIDEYKWVEEDQQQGKEKAKVIP